MSERLSEELETRAGRLLPDADGSPLGDLAAALDEVERLRARVAELEAPGECASVHKLRALVRQAAREGYECGTGVPLSMAGCGRADAIADRLLTEARPGHRRDSGGPA